MSVVTWTHYWMFRPCPSWSSLDSQPFRLDFTNWILDLGKPINIIHPPKSHRFWVLSDLKSAITIKFQSSDFDHFSSSVLFSLSPDLSKLLLTISQNLETDNYLGNHSQSHPGMNFDSINCYLNCDWKGDICCLLESISTSREISDFNFHRFKGFRRWLLSPWIVPICAVSLLDSNWQLIELHWIEGWIMWISTVHIQSPPGKQSIFCIVFLSFVFWLFSLVLCFCPSCSFSFLIQFVIPHFLVGSWFVFHLSFCFSFFPN
jgi:hypothetical protein